jgi:transaldolase
VEELLRKYDDFRRAYEEDGLSIDDFNDFPPTRRTLRQFIGACHELAGQIREFMIPNPDLK